MSWRDDPDLVRREGPESEAPEQLQVDPGWEQVFAMVDQLLGERQSWSPGDWAMRSAFKMAAGVARKRVMEDPDGTRTQVVDAVRAVAAALRIEADEIYTAVGG